MGDGNYGEVGEGFRQLVDEILEKVSLVITYENQEVEKGSPLVQKQVEKKNWGDVGRGGGMAGKGQ